MFYDVDFHIHTCFSDGEGTIEDILSISEERKLRAIAITDHFEPRDSRDLKKSIEEFRRHIKVIRGKAVSCGLKVFVGIETSLFFEVEEELREEVDLVIRSVHFFPPKIDISCYSLFDERLWEIYKNEVLELLQIRFTDIAGHIMGYFPLPSEWVKGLTFAERRELEKKIRECFFDEEWQERVIEQAIKNNVAIEIHNPTSTPDENFIRQAVSQGAKLSLGSDAHLLGWVGKVDYGKSMFSRLQIPKKNLFWPEGAIN